MADYVIELEPVQINFSRVAFRLTARDCLDCFEAYTPSHFSAVKYFLACRAIELALKALHLDAKDRKFVKEKLGHNLCRSYDGLDPSHKILTKAELELLRAASDLYDTKIKAFEYIQPIHAGHAYTDFPDLEQLHLVANRLVEHVEQHQAANP